MTTTNIDTAFAAAISAATALGNSVARIAPVPVSGETGQTVQTDRITAHGGAIGFRVTAVIKIGGYRTERIHETLPVVKETAWPTDIAGEAAKWLSDSIIAGEAWLSKWFWGSRLTDMAVMYLQALTAVAGDQAALAAAKPILSALHTWVYAVRSAAASGQRMFSQPPHTYEEFVTENH
jgi:hypothetical protein